MPHQIFICAAPGDEAAAKAAYTVLEGEGIGCWTASRDLTAGADPVETARAAIAAAQVVVVIFSAKSNEAEAQIRREMQFAAESQTPVLPVRVENVKPVKVLEYYLPNNQFIDAFTPPLDGHLRGLVAMLKPALEKAAPRPPMPAPTLTTPPPEPAAPIEEAVAPSPDSDPPQVAALEPVADIQMQSAERPAPAVEVALPPPHSVPANEPAVAEVALAVDTSPAKVLPIRPPRDEEHWFRKPVILALAAMLVIALAGGLWWVFKPGPTSQETLAWNTASQQDAVPAYQTYLGAWPQGFYRDKASARMTILKTEAQDAFAKAKAANTAAAYEDFLATYAKQGIDVAEARSADDAARAAEAKAKTAFDAASAAHTRESYKSFLADFGTSSYAARARQNLAACHTETRDTTTVKTTQISESGSGSGTSSEAACNDAKTKATVPAENSCKESKGRMGGIQVKSQTPQEDGLQGGRILGSIYGAISGDRKVNWKCTEAISASCEISTTGMQQVDVCP